jgi:alkylation response protein AidB-like acyl-CoA dehydrogenase
MTIDLLPSAEQEEIVASVRAVLAAEPDRRGPEQWAECAGLGWFGLGLAEDAGGVGYGLAEEALLFREVGRHLAAGPFLATTLGARLAAAAAGDADLASTILAGEARVAWARTSAEGLLVVDGDGAELALLLDGARAALLDLSGLAPGRAIDSLDLGTSLATHEGTAPERVSITDPSLGHRALVLAAAALSGIAEEARDLATAHAKERHQFGSPIGVHQAVKHPCADMAIRCEAAGAQLFVAALHVDASAPSAEVDALSAAVVAADAAFSNARASLQIHGGMGYTTEHTCHRLVKRAHVIDRMLGGTAGLLDRLVDR